ncbi:MAG: tRNA (adenosine(37)-N6)-threonylcarbamoyltransferase complex ATPase subunit type 1 TsaE [Ignavibacteriae bacterium]|nr:MAG: tRNA (adenosine(37)-N6)-threonylcarbamoyltransferase complex ATPase subunit type 1 TsaE [Ignavibacteriota bacterium]
MRETRITTSAEETIAYARLFAGRLRRGDVVTMFGDLGSGKTQFVKGVAQGFCTERPATSPSFVILNRYSGSDKNNSEILLYHFDLYRVRSLSEIYDLGYEEFLQGDGICLIEWAEMLGELLPERRYEVRFSLGADEHERRIEIDGVHQEC